jgi:hypothetical protein
LKSNLCARISSSYPIHLSHTHLSILSLPNSPTLHLTPNSQSQSHSQGIADTDWTIRRAILTSLDARFDQYLAQAENLHLLFMALNDEVGSRFFIKYQLFS